MPSRGVPSSLLLLLLGVAAVVAGAAATPVELLGGGATTVTELQRQWSLAFHTLKPTQLPLYAAVGSGQGVQGVTQFTYSWAASEIVPDAGPLLSFPLVSSPVVLIVNIPELQSAQLVLSLDAVALILQGNITHWNDVRVCQLNAALCARLPAAPVRVVLRSDSSGTTLALTTALHSGSTAWRFGAFSSWPADFVGVRGPGSLWVSSSVVVLPYTLSYVTLSWAQQFDMPFAALTSGVNGTMARPHDDTWPIRALTHILLNSLFPDCAVQRLTLRFLRWGLLNDRARDAARGAGYEPLPATEAAAAVEQMSRSVVCARSGEPLMVPHVLEPDGAAALIAMQVLGVISVLGSTALLSWLLLCGWRSLALSEGFFLAFVQLASAFLGLAPLALARFPRSDAVCAALPWVTMLPVALLVGALCARLVQVVSIWLGAKSALGASVLLRRFVLAYGIFVALQLLVLALWSGLDTPRYTTLPLDWIDQTLVQTCVSRNETVWLAVSVALQMAGCLAGIVMLLLGWKFNPVVGESRWLLMTLYSILVALVIYVVVVVVQLQQEPPVSHAVASALVGWLQVFLSLWCYALYFSKARQLARNPLAAGAAAPPGSAAGGGDGMTLSNIEIHSGGSGAVLPGTSSSSRVHIHSHSSGGWRSQQSTLPPMQYPPLVGHHPDDAVVGIDAVDL